jgi:ACS family pantothenate transporter-like MFS transporter
MYAMIGTSIALVVWTTGMLFMTNREEKKRVVRSEEDVAAPEKAEVLEEKV